MHSAISFAVTCLFFAGTAISAPQYVNQCSSMSTLYTKSTSTSYIASAPGTVCKNTLYTTSTSAPTYKESPPACTTPLPLPDQDRFESLALGCSAVKHSKLLEDDDFVFSFDTPCRNSPELGIVSDLREKTTVVLAAW